MSENGDPSENLAYRQLGKEGNPFDRGKPSFDSPEPAESQDGGRPDGDPAALVDDTFVSNESTMSQDQAGEGAVAGDADASMPDEGDDEEDAEDDAEEFVELLPGGGRLEDPGSDEKGLGAPLP